MSKTELIPEETVERAILVVRGHKVILDSDLAELYGVTVKRLNEQVKRNGSRFPQDFLFRLTADEWRSLRSQFATLEHGTGQHRKYLPFAFTEHGALMAASVLSSQRAVEMSILVVRAFVKLRSILAAHRELASKLDELERRLSTHDRQLVSLFDALRRLTAPGDRAGRPIGFGREGT
jgi:phage regulator Rha-like protein